ncbi:DUF6588 family protein [Aureibacter tunicatorum]|uniref:Uncharacterized protein n=1 Tax=Aureibacter tunicatorum TaxID=866807 RepID=A0AAE4BS67_9BACT|nr:DUF6588 family protein [Aureibacter tunicatorum]MDR6238047.1 hypothetical protein [Aureibacter tunicatorum]BDD03080.1 hypothetical protein AUTU_05630 [Aureibacter tunicatorum]
MHDFIRIFILLILLALLKTVAYAQRTDIDQIVPFDPRSREVYLDNYGRSITEAIGTGLGGAWTSSAKAHNTGGFEVKFILNNVYIPKNERMFDFDSAQYVGLTVNGKTSASLPTITGNNPIPGQDSITFYRQVQNRTDITIDPASGIVGVPHGIDLKGVNGGNFYAMPLIQGSVGVLPNTDILFRFTPNIGNKAIRTISYGGGFKLSTSNWFGTGEGALPVDIATVLAFSYGKVQMGIEQSQNTKYEDDPLLQVDSWTITAQLLASKEFSFIEVFALVGYDNYKSDLTMKGLYNYTLNGLEYTEQDPVSVGYNKGSVRGNVGFNINVSVVSFGFSYSLQAYQSMHFSLGINHIR